MANTLRFKRGLVSGIPTAALGEPLFTTDTFDLYIGNGTGNTRFQKYIASGTTSQLLRGDGSLLTMPIVLTSPSNGQVLKYNGTSWVNDSDAGITGSGTTNYLPKFTGASTLGNSLLQEQTNSIGLGITPSAWHSNTKVIESGGLGSFFGTFNGSASGGDVWIGNNTYYDGSLKYAHSSRAAVLYTQYSGKYEWYIAPSGTAGNVITFTNAMTLTNNGRLILNSTTDNGLRFQVTGTGFFSDSVGIGSTSITGISLRVAKTMTGAVNAVGIYNDGQVQSDVTTAVRMYRSQLNIVNATFTIPDVYHYLAEQGTIGASSTVTNQYGFITGDLSKGTNNYAFYGSLSAGTGKWNIYMAGTANNYMAGSLGIGTTSLTAVSLSVSKNITGNVDSNGIRNNGVIQSDVTSSVNYFISNASTQAASFTLSDLRHFIAVQSALGAGSAVTNQYGFFANSNLTGATNNYGFYGNIASGTGRWNLYMNGSANNYMAGNLSIGITTPAGNLDVYNATNSSIYNRVGAAGANWLTTSTQSQIGTYTNHNFVIKTNDTGRINIVNNGNVLIYSTTDLGQKLQVTGDGYFSGSVGIGTTTLAGRSLSVSKNVTGSTNAFIVYNNGQIQTDVTASANYFYSEVSTAASTTLTHLRHNLAVQGTFGAGTTITNQVGYYAHSSLIGATNNYGFLGEIPSGTGRWNLYMNGTAANYLAGRLSIGTTTSSAILATNTSQQLIGEFNSTNANGGYIQIQTSGANYGYFGSAASLGSGSATDFALRYQNNLVFLSSATERMRLDASGNLGIGTTTIPNRLTVSGDAANTAVVSGTTVQRVANFVPSNNFGNAIFAFDTTNGNAYLYNGYGGGALIFGVRTAPDNFEAMRIFAATRNVSIGTTTDAGFKLDVNGTMRVSGASTFVGNLTVTRTTSSPVNLNASDGSNNTSTEAQVQVTANSTQGYFLALGPSKTPYKIITSGGVALYKSNTSGDLSILNDNTVGSITMAAGGSSTAHFTIASTGAATFSSSVTATSYNATTQNIFSVGGTEGMRLTATNRNLHIGTFSSDSGEKLQVVGTAKIGTYSTTGYSLVVQNNGANDVSGIRISTGATVDGYLSLAYDATNTYGSIQAGDNNVFRNIVINRQGGSVGIGANPNNSAVLQADSTTRGFLPPRMTTTQRNAIPTPAAGLIVYDTTDNKHYGYNGTTWNAFY